MKFKRMIAGFMTFVMAVAVFATPLVEYLPVKGDGLTASAASNEYAMFPLSTVNISQGDGVGSHYYSYALDLVGDTNVRAPFTGKIVDIDYNNFNAGHRVVFQSLNNVVFADGSVGIMTIKLNHDNDISDLKKGQVINQGQIFYQAGKYGNVTGTHVHIECAKGAYAGQEYLGAEKYAVLKNRVHVYNALWLSSSTSRPKDKGYNWRVLSGSPSTEPSTRFSVSIDNITANNAVINFVAYKKTTESTKSFSIKVWETNNSSNSKTYSFNSSYPNVGKTQNTGLSFNLKDEVKFTMKHATKYSFTITSNYTDNGASKSYTSNVYTLTTTGSHSYGSWTTSVAATCTSAGTQKRSCSCGDVQTQSIPALGHNYTVTTVYPTETSQGYTLHTCSRCGDSYRDNYTDKLEVNVTNIEHFGLKGRAADALRLKWAKNSTVEGYDLYILDVDKQWTCIASLDADTTEYRISGLSPSTKYTFKIVGYRYSNGEYKYSPSDTIASYTTNPSIVKGNVLKGRASDALRLGWSKNSSADGYILEQLIDGSWHRIAKLTKNTVTEYRVSGLAAGSVATFRIKSYNMVSKTALYSKYVTVKYRTDPTAVSALSLKGSASNAVRISWDINLSADGYIIEQKSGTKWVRVEKITKNSTAQFRKSGLKPNTSYTFRVKAYKMSGKTALYSGYKTITVKTK